MTDLTPLFNQCVSIVEKKFTEEILHNKTKNNNSIESNEKFIIKDTFDKECKELYHNLIGLKALIEEVRPKYLSQLNSGTSESSSIQQDKDRFDQEVKFRIQKLFEKLKIIQSYEEKRHEIAEKNTKGWMEDIFGSEDEMLDLFIKTIREHRKLVLRALGDLSNEVDNFFDELHRERIDRQNQLEKLNFQNLDDQLDIDYTNANAFLEVGNSGSLSPEYDEENQLSLTQEQLQDLDQENKVFLDMKTGQLNKVTELHKTMLDISTLQTELTFQIEMQGDKMSNIIENQSQIEVDVSLGNKTLNVAKSKNKRGSNMIVLTCISIGMLLLLLDWIS